MCGLNLYTMTIEQLNKDFIDNPYSYWAKKFDTVAHITTKDYRTVCGSHGALLGNNYAPNLKSVCPKCVNIKYGIF